MLQQREEPHLDMVSSMCLGTSKGLQERNRVSVSESRSSLGQEATLGGLEWKGHGLKANLGEPRVKDQEAEEGN